MNILGLSLRPLGLINIQPGESPLLNGLGAQLYLPHLYPSLGNRDKSLGSTTEGSYDISKCTPPLWAQLKIGHFRVMSD